MSIQKMKSKIIYLKVLLSAMVFPSVGCSPCSSWLGSGNETLKSTEKAEAFCDQKGGVAYFTCGYALKCRNGAELR